MKTRKMAGFDDLILVQPVYREHSNNHDKQIIHVWVTAITINMLLTCKQQLHNKTRSNIVTYNIIRKIVKLLDRISILSRCPKQWITRPKFFLPPRRGTLFHIIIEDSIPHYFHTITKKHPTNNCK